MKFKKDRLTVISIYLTVFACIFTLNALLAMAINGDDFFYLTTPKLVIRLIIAGFITPHILRIRREIKKS